MAALAIIGRGDSTTALKLPLYLSKVSAGFPSPATDEIESTLDLNQLCIKHPAATYLVRVHGDSMSGAGIFHGDILVVDRSLDADHDDIIVAGIAGELTCKKLQVRPAPALIPCNPQYKPIPLSPGEDLDVFGVVSSIVRNLK